MYPTTARTSKNKESFLIGQHKDHKERSNQQVIRTSISIACGGGCPDPKQQQVMRHRWPSGDLRRGATLLVLPVLIAWCALISSTTVAATTASLQPERQVDLLEGLSLHNLSASVPGVSLAPGPHSLRPAIYLQGDFRELRMPHTLFSRVVSLLRHNSEFTLMVSLRQDVANSGTILSFAHGYNRYLELQSSGRKDEVRLHYTHSGSVFVEIFPFRLADGAWHRLAVSVSGVQVELLVDCQRIYKRVIREPDRNFSATLDSQLSSGETINGGELQLWLGQRNNKHSLFKGALQEVRVVSGPHSYLSQCPYLDSSCPTCGEFQQLAEQFNMFMKEIDALKEEVKKEKARMDRMEECECQKSCRVNGSVHADGATWQRDCDLCACVRGEVQCRPVQCPPTTCKKPEIAPGECCPSCLKECYLKGKIFEHGEAKNWNQCVECVCQDGVLHCNRIDPIKMCPPLPCPPEQQFSVPDACCKFCPGVDYCAKGHNCHDNATCLNLQTTYTCQCNIGYEGDGQICTDVDECREEGGPNGHHCRSNTKCHNTPGSYTCECLPGFRRAGDRFNCVEHDECRSGEHECDLRAQCLNTQGSYHCQCMAGYSGDGFTCKPECNQTCQNGGVCVAPGECLCRRGYGGASCEQDVDECALGLAACHTSSTCVNMPGWYYCACRPGFRSVTHDNSQGALCRDIDECYEGSKTCHPSAQCVNTEGGFECTCEGRGSECSLNCMYGGVEVEDGSHVQGTACQKCLCQAGRITCERPECDCDDANMRLECCPQCDTSSQCHHQELHHVVFRSGERWIYQCQTCECLHGEVDCWPVECPPVSCPNPVKNSGDCCARCEDDPCALEYSTNSSTETSQGQPCSYAGRLLASGSEWRADASSYDKCTSCRCKDGQLCCSYVNQCTSPSSDEQGSSELQLLGRMLLLGSDSSGTTDTSASSAAAISSTARDVHSPETLVSATKTTQSSTEKVQVDSTRGHQ